MATTTKIDFTRVNNDVNGNPRYVCKYLDLINPEDTAKAKDLSKNTKPFKFFVEHEYEIALNKAKTIGGRKFNNNQYGGGIVFQSFNIADTEKAIHEVQKLSI